MEICGGGQYHQQNRVYEMGDVAMCLPAQIPGGSYLYLEVIELKEIEVIGDMYEDNGHGSANGRVYGGGVLHQVLEQVTSNRRNG